MNSEEVNFLTTNTVILDLSEVLFEARNRIGLSGSPIRIQRLWKYKKIIVLYFYNNLMLRLQLQQSNESISRYAVTFWGYFGRFSRLETNGFGTINPNSDAAPIKTYKHAQNSFPDHKCGHFCDFVGISRPKIWPFLRFRRYFLSIERYSDMMET